ncbi:MAG: DMT family transporter [Deltaproteobacteria bacterium]|nr:DMT family transporter [Deltaproteobacteria bacterium]
MPLSLTPMRIGVLMALGAIVGWSFNFIFSRSLAGVLPPFTFTLLRTVVALAVFAPFALGTFRDCLPYIRKRPCFYIFLSLTGIGYYNALVYLAGQTTSVINMSLLALSSPIFTLLLGRMFYGEQLTHRRVFGLAAAVCGVTLLTARGDLALLKTLSFQTGDLFMLTGAFIFACYSVSLRRMDPEVTSHAFILTMFIVSFVFLLPLSAWELARGMTVTFTPVAVTGIVYLGIVASIFCYICWNGAIARIGAGNVALIYYTMPLISGFEAVLLLGEPLRWFHFASGALIITGVLVATRR